MRAARLVIFVPVQLAAAAISTATARDSRANVWRRCDGVRPAAAGAAAARGVHRGRGACKRGQLGVGRREHHPACSHPAPAPSLPRQIEPSRQLVPVVAWRAVAVPCLTPARVQQPLQLRNRCVFIIAHNLRKLLKAPLQCTGYRAKARQKHKQQRAAVLTCNRTLQLWGPWAMPCSHTACSCAASRSTG